MNRMLANLVMFGAFGALSSPAAAIVDGSFDTTWAGGGYIVFPGDPVNSGLDSEAKQIIVESNGNLLLGGDISGIPDTAFADHGVAFQRFASFCTYAASSHALALDSADRILVAGQCNTSSGEYFFLERLHGDDGSLDTTFGISGHSYGRFSATSPINIALDAAFDASGRPVIAGYTEPNDTEQAGVARLTYDLIFTNNMESAPPGQ